MADHVLVSNSVHPFVFTDRVDTLLSKGQGKFWNLIIVSFTNCNNFFYYAHLKSFSKRFQILLQVQGWVGGHKIEVIFLNDFHLIFLNGVTFCCY